MSRHDPAKSGHSNIQTVEDLANETLEVGEILRPGRLTLEGRRGSRIVWRAFVQFERERARELRAKAKELDDSVSNVLARALAAYGIGGEYVEGEGA